MFYHITTNLTIVSALSRFLSLVIASYFFRLLRLLLSPMFLFFIWCYLCCSSLLAYLKYSNNSNPFRSSRLSLTQNKWTKINLFSLSPPSEILFFSFQLFSPSLSNQICLTQKGKRLKITRWQLPPNHPLAPHPRKRQILTKQKSCFAGNSALELFCPLLFREIWWQQKQ